MNEPSDIGVIIQASIATFGIVVLLIIGMLHLLMLISDRMHKRTYPQDTALAQQALKHMDAPTYRPATVTSYQISLVDEQLRVTERGDVHMWLQTSPCGQGKWVLLNISERDKRKFGRRVKRISREQGRRDQQKTALINQPGMIG